MGEPIGQGGFGAVFEAKWKKKKVAVKVCPGNLVKNLSREIEVLTSLPPHPHMLTFFGIALGSDGISTQMDHSTTTCMKKKLCPPLTRVLRGPCKWLAECSISMLTTWSIVI